VEQSLYTAAQVRELDRLAIEEHGIPGLTLMERAGLACFYELQQRWPEANRITVLCGLGNNAGDGYVLARLAHEHNLKVSVVQVGDKNKLKGDAKTAFSAMTKSGQTVAAFHNDVPEADVYVDALFGTGLDREVAGDWRSVIERVNAKPQPRLSIDIPSGLNADTGQVMGAAIQADVCVTFIGRKRGLTTGQAADHCGTVIFNDLQVPVEIYNEITSESRWMDWDQFRINVSPRQRTAHKGHFGHVLVIGGDHGYSGAVRMAAEAAARTGAGLVSVATRKDHANQINIGRPELMCHAVESAADLIPLLAKATVIAIGPGLGESEWSLTMMAKILESQRPMVMDADGLNLLARDPVHNDNRIITPHPGEAARLLDSTSAEIQSDRFAASSALQKRYGGVVVLKGSGTIVTDPDQKHSVCVEGNPGMASGGMGDVLTGIIAGLLAQGYDQVMASQMGVCLHARAADNAAFVPGERGLLASDLFAHIRRELNPDS